jgi:nitroimidazol reductase NimA-like FMN-containing flavoprotein (pyridoxamine 5'-phosphate oxidase superfamily)
MLRGFPSGQSPETGEVAMGEPRAEQLPLPKVYGSPKKILSWEDVKKDLEDAPVYWVASVRPDGRPHVIPRDGVWLDDTWYYGGSDETVHNKNVQKNPALSLHIGDGMKAIIVEGTADRQALTRATAERLANVNNTKYKHYGMNATAEQYIKEPPMCLKAERVIAWNLLFEDATRFTFG